MTENIVENASKYSLHNRKAIEASGKCGCYYCCSIFEAKLVKDYTDADDTALCPMCGIDSVIAEKTVGNITEEMLEELNQRWF